MFDSCMKNYGSLCGSNCFSLVCLSSFLLSRRLIGNRNAIKTTFSLVYFLCGAQSPNVQMSGNTLNPLCVSAARHLCNVDCWEISLRGRRCITYFACPRVCVCVCGVGASACVCACACMSIVITLVIRCRSFKQCVSVVLCVLGQ